MIYAKKENLKFITTFKRLQGISAFILHILLEFLL